MADEYPSTALLKAMKAAIGLALGYLKDGLQPKYMAVAQNADGERTLLKLAGVNAQNVREAAVKASHKMEGMAVILVVILPEVLEKDGKSIKAITAEGFQMGDANGFIVAQPYRPKSLLKKFMPLGDPIKMGTAPNIL